MNSRGNFHNIDFILHIKNSTSCYPFRLKEQNITGKLKAGNKKKLSPFNNDSALSMTIKDEAYSEC